MNELLKKTPDEFNVKPTATTRSQRVVVKLPMPHPISSDHVGELSRMTNDEFRTLHHLAFDYIKGELQKIKEIRSATFEFPI